MYSQYNHISSKRDRPSKSSVGDRSTARIRADDIGTMFGAVMPAVPVFATYYFLLE